jgi:hypothetical protein
MAKRDERVDAAREVAARLKAVAEQYERAVEQSTLPGPDTGQSPAELANTLLEIVGGLPELRDEPPPRRSRATREWPQDRASFAELLANDDRPVDRSPPKLQPAARAHPEVLQLLGELHSHDLTALSLPLFRALAEELAARARELQERGVADPERKLGQVIRVLTRCAHEQGAPNIFGLSRQHEGDWHERAAAARQRRLRLQSGEPRHHPTKARAKPKHEDERRGPIAHWELPHLAARASKAAVVVFGGARKAEKLSSIRAHLGFEIEWVETSAPGTTSTAVLERRIREGRIAAVVVLEGLVKHKHSEPVIAAARQMSVPVAYAGRAGTGALEQALREIDEGLAQAKMMHPG